MYIHIYYDSHRRAQPLTLTNYAISGSILTTIHPILTIHVSIYTSANSFKLNYKSYIKRLNHFSHLASLVQILPMPCFIALPLCLS